MKPIQPSELRNRIRIEQATEGDPSASGETTKTWSEVWKCGAKIEPTWVREYERALQRQLEMTLLLKIRYVPEVSITSAMRVKFGSRTLAIVGVQNVEERNLELLLACKEEG